MTARATTRRGQQVAKEPSKVRCADCRNFKRDTEGISRTAETGEFFMREPATDTQRIKPERQ